MSNDIPDDRNLTTAEREWDNEGISFNDNTNTYKLVRALLAPADRIDADLEAIKDAHHIDTATGKQLDKIGRLVNLRRKNNGSDEKYRARLKVQFRVGNIGTTFDAFSEFSSSLLDTDIDNIFFTFDFDSNAATVDVSADPEIYDNADITRDEARDFLGRAVPAGHNVRVFNGGTFRLKSDGDTDDPSLGLTSDSMDDGGTLASEIL